MTDVETNITPRAAVARGHRMMTIPAVGFMAAGALTGYLLRGSSETLDGMLLGGLVGWIWWSWATPRWRDWVEDQGLKPEDVQEEAARTGLIWPRGSFFERTEFRRRNGRRGW